MKQELRVKYYVRYTDDFVVVSRDRDYLEHLLKPVSKFLNDKLRLSLHPQKVLLRKYGQGIDFLGYVVLPNHIVLRTKTKRRIFRKLQKHLADYKEGTLSEEILNQSTASYLGVLSHSNSFKLSNRLNNLMISK